MAVQLNPYLSFDGNAREAMEFYQSVLGGELRVNTFGEFGMQDPAHANKVMHSALDTDDLVLMGADLPPGEQHRPGANMSVCLSGDADTDGDTLRGQWAKLSDGGTVTVPLEKQMWGDEFGMCVDQFGISWMVNINAATD